MSDLDLLYTEVEEDLRASVRNLLINRCHPAAVTRMYDGDRALVKGLWESLTSLGLAGLMVPERRAGQGASAREAAVVLEELGRTVAPVPFLTSSVIATTVLLESSSVLLEQLATGKRTAALVVPWSTAPNGELSNFRVKGTQLSGRITSVAGAIEADVLLVLAGGQLHAVDASSATLRRHVSLDMTRQLADVTLDGAEGTLVLDDAEPAVRRALDAGAALLASEQVGLARWCLETTVDYLRVRKQFGRPLGGFQALKHRLADLYTSVESATAAARYGSATLAEGDSDESLAASLAQAYCGDLAVLAAEEAVQLHAGIGMTWEHPAHLYLKRAKSNQIALGTSGRHRARLSELVELPR